MSDSVPVGTGEGQEARGRTIRERVSTQMFRRVHRIYPLPVKARTTINRWADWPEDCVDVIRRIVSGWYGTGGIFKCDDCGRYCEPHPYGVPHIGREHPIIVCDDCLIDRARALAPAPSIPGQEER